MSELQLSLCAGEGDCVQLVPSINPTAPLHHVFLVHAPSKEHLIRVSPGDVSGDTPSRVIGFQLWEKRGNYLRIHPQGHVDFEGGKGQFALFEKVDFHDGCGIALRCLGEVRTTNGVRTCPYLSVGPHGTLASTLNPNLPQARWFFTVGLPFAPQQFDSNFALSDEQAAFFGREGYLILRNIVPPQAIEDAKRFVNYTLGRGPAAWVPEEHHPSQFRLEHSNHPAILALAKCPGIASALESIFGPGNVLPIHGGQLAIRFPTLGNLNEDWREPQPLPLHTGLDWHIDGQGKESYLPFSMIVKVALSDQTLENNGNITIFPRSHRNPDVLDYYHRTIDARDTHGVGLVKPDLGREPLQVLLAAGDALLLHPYVGHRVGTNISPNIRYSIIFRANHKMRASHHQLSREALRSAPLLEFPRCMKLLQQHHQMAPVSAASSDPVLVGRVVTPAPRGAAATVGEQQNVTHRPQKVVAAIPVTHKLPKNECRSM